MLCTGYINKNGDDRYEHKHTKIWTYTLPNARRTPEKSERKKVRT